MKKLSTKQIVTGGVLLAIMIASQFLKNLSVYITGPIVNATLLIATLSLGLSMGIILSIIAPVTSFFITGSPVIAAAPFLMLPAIAMGNIIICAVMYVIEKRFKKPFSLEIGLGLGVLLKALFMGAVISKWILPTFATGLSEKVISVAEKTFSIVQLITGAIGAVLAFLIWLPLKKLMTSENN